MAAKKIFAVVMLALCAGQASAQSIQVPGKEQAGKVPVTCRRYALENFCVPNGWKTKDPVKFKTGDNLGAHHTFYLNQPFSIDRLNYGIAGAVNIKPYKNWAEIQVTSLGFYKDATKMDRSRPISEYPEVADCSAGTFPCYQYLGKKRVNSFDAYYYRVHSEASDWFSGMYVYLIDKKSAYRLEYRAHKDDFRKYERQFYTLLASFRLNKPAR